MNYNDLANLLYPDVTKTIDDLEKMYPERNLPEGAEVMRFAPSPTGRIHLGNLYASFILEVKLIKLMVYLLLECKTLIKKEK